MRPGGNLKKIRRIDMAKSIQLNQRFPNSIGLRLACALVCLITALLMSGCQFSRLPHLKVSVVGPEQKQNQSQPAGIHETISPASHQEIINELQQNTGDTPSNASLVQPESVTKPQPQSSPNVFTMTDQMEMNSKPNSPDQEIGMSQVINPGPAIQEHSRPLEMNSSPSTGNMITGNTGTTGDQTVVTVDGQPQYDNYRDYYQTVRNQRSSGNLPSKIRGKHLPAQQQTATERALELKDEIFKLQKENAAQLEQMQFWQTEYKNLREELNLTIQSLKRANELLGDVQQRYQQSQQENAALRMNIAELSRSISRTDSQTEAVLARLRNAIRGTVTDGPAGNLRQQKPLQTPLPENLPRPVN